MFSAIISDSFLMPVDDMVSSMVQRVHVVEIDFSIVQGITVFVVCYHSRRRLCDLAVHADLVSFPVYVVFPNGIPAMTGLDRVPVLTVEPGEILWVNNGKFTLGQWDQVLVDFCVGV